VVERRIGVEIGRIRTVVREKGGPFNVETLTLEGPRRDEVLVKIVATGLCHTDMVARDQSYPVLPRHEIGSK